MMPDQSQRALRICACLALPLALSGYAAAQVEQGRFVGEITDPSGSVIAGAAIKLTNTGTGITQAAVTD